MRGSKRTGSRTDVKRQGSRCTKEFRESKMQQCNGQPKNFVSRQEKIAARSASGSARRWQMYSECTSAPRHSQEHRQVQPSRHC